MQLIMQRKFHPAKKQKSQKGMVIRLQLELHCSGNARSKMNQVLFLFNF